MASLCGYGEVPFGHPPRSIWNESELRLRMLMVCDKTAGTPKVRDERAPLFELYVVHSKGVTCLTITKEDIGWDANNKVVHGIDAAKEGVVDLKELKLGSIIEETRSKSPLEEPTPSSSAGRKKKSKKHQPTVEPVEEGEGKLPDSELETTKAPAPAISTGRDARVDSAEADSLARISTKKSKKKAAQAIESATSAKPPSRTESPTKVDSFTRPNFDQPQQAEDMDPAAPPFSTQSPEMEASKSDKVSVGISGDWLDKEIKKIQEAVSKDFKKELSNLYTNIQNDRLVQDTAATARQETMLRLVSTSLTNNVDKTLARHIHSEIQQVILPALSTITANAVSSNVGDGVAKALHQMLPHQLGTQLPSAVSAALNNPQLSRSVAETVAFQLAKTTESQLMDLANRHIIPAFKNLAVSAAEDAAARVEARMMGEIRSVEAGRRRDSARMEKLGSIIQGMSETLHTMSQTQVAFQRQVAGSNKQLVLAADPASQPASTAMSPLPAPIARPKPVKPKTQEELDYEEILELMQAGKYEDGSIKWLHSAPAKQAMLFDNLFIQFTPDYLATDVSPLVAFSVGITVGSSLQANTSARLDWMLGAFNAVDLQVCLFQTIHDINTNVTQDAEISDLAEHAPGLLNTLIQRLESMYMSVAENDVGDPILRKIGPVAKKAKDLRAAMSDIALAAKTRRL